MSASIRIPMIVLASFVATLAMLMILGYSVLLVRGRRLRSEHGALAMVRKAAGRDGQVVKDGPWTIWYSGPDDPVPMLREQMEAGRRRFATLTGAADVAGPPLRFFVFHDRGAFLTFHSRIVAGVDFSSYDGFYVGAPYSLITLCTAPAPRRVTDPEGTVRMWATMPCWNPSGDPASSWLQLGLAISIGVQADRDELARLNRKMVASLARGTALSTEIFTRSQNDLIRLVRGSKDPRNLQKLRQFVYQSWSIVEYLCGESAPREMRPALGAFLRDPRSKADPEGSFRNHFGQGYGPFLDGWRCWVLDRGIGAYEPPPDRIREGLLERVLPAIRDRRAKRGDRLVAIGEWAGPGSCSAPMP